MRETWKYTVLFFGGVLLGTLIVQWQKHSVVPGIFSEYFLSQYASLKLDAGRLLRYVGSCRIGQYFLVVCCGTLQVASLLIGVLLFALGLCWGTMLSISTIQLGMKGILLCVSGIFPQIFFYLPAFGWMILWIRKKGSSKHRYAFLTVAGFLFLLFGIGTEVYVNPSILQYILWKLS